MRFSFFFLATNKIQYLKWHFFCFCFSPKCKTANMLTFRFANTCDSHVCAKLYILFFFLQFSKETFLLLAWCVTGSDAPLATSTMLVSRPSRFRWTLVRRYTHTHTKLGCVCVCVIIKNEFRIVSCLWADVAFYLSVKFQEKKSNIFKRSRRRKSAFNFPEGNMSLWRV